MTPVTATVPVTAAVVTDASRASRPTAVATALTTAQTAATSTTTGSTATGLAYTGASSPALPLTAALLLLLVGAGVLTLRRRS